MIISVSEIRQYIESDETDQALEARLQALEMMVREYTNNNFQVRPFRAVAVAVAEGNKLIINSVVPFTVGDTLQITESELMQNQLVTIASVEKGTVIVKEDPTVISTNHQKKMNKIKYNEKILFSLLEKWL